MSKDLVLDFNGVEEAVAERSATLPVGVHELTIANVEYKQLDNEKKTEYIAITVRNQAGTQMNEEKFFISEKALDGTRRRIKHLVHAAVSEEASGKSYSIDALRKLLGGKSFRGNIIGEEFLGQDGAVYVKTQLAYSGFAESLSVPIEDSGLKARPIKKLVGSKATKPTDSDALISEDLKF